MNCDLVFEILTRGPFPSGEPTDVSVELHLARCHECRELAEALRPAVALFHEALASEEEARHLPGYYGALHEADFGLSAAIAAMPGEDFRATPPLPPHRRRWRHSLERMGPLTGGMVVGGAVCLLLALLLAQTTTSPEPRSAVPHAMAPAATFAGLAASPESVRASLVALNLPEDCWRLPAEHNALATAREDLQEPAIAPAYTAEQLLCCTHCHSAAAPQRRLASPVALLQREACVTCHHFE